MEAVFYNRKQGGMHYPLAFIAMLILLLLNANSCCGGAAVGILVKSNSSTTFGCDGRLDECLMEEDLELELLINPYISRILGAGHSSTGGTQNPNKPALPCGKPEDPYSKCIGKKNVNKESHCSKYNRGPSNCG
ncbi:hypothetical protein F2P56_021717 [Juglans regia]|uniref:Rapid ALkalinization Factor n=1 Tax=Juglans regia TaxID=51240 RepID=A0A833WN78_JUGRE|nr:hypothetical protein F2P56_021717 [Juglans regia]